MTSSAKASRDIFSIEVLHMREKMISARTYHRLPTVHGWNNISKIVLGIHQERDCELGLHDATRDIEDSPIHALYIGLVTRRESSLIESHVHLISSKETQWRCIKYSKSKGRNETRLKKKRDYPIQNITDFTRFKLVLKSSAFNSTIIITLMRFNMFSQTRYWRCIYFLIIFCNIWIFRR